MYAVAGNRFLFTNREQRLRRMLDQITDAAGGKDSPRSGKAASATPRLRLQLDFRALRQIPDVKKALKMPSSNAGLVAFLGGWLDLLRRGDRLDVVLSFRERCLDLKLSVPISPQNATTGVRGFFAESAHESAAPLLKLPGTIYTASWYRDYRSLWRNRKKLLAADSVEKLEKGEKQLRDQLAVIGAKALPSRIISELGPHFRIAAVRRKQSQYRFPSKSRLPAFVLAVDLHNETAFRDKVMPLLRGIGFILAVGEAKMLARKSNYRGGELTSLRFRDDPVSASTGNKIRFQFTPTYCITRGHFIVGSTESVVKQTIDELHRQSKQSRSRTDSARVATTEIQQLSFIEMANAVRDYRGPVARTLALNLGLRMTEANAELEILARALRHLGTANVRVTRSKQSFEYRITIGDEKR
ncbi:MAG: hypothetical protein IID45_03815 [Planctomycetes bacterium]|nr:hypothetical protein [Planctomycetota bacterium]